MIRVRKLFRKNEIPENRIRDRKLFRKNETPENRIRDGKLFRVNEKTAGLKNAPAQKERQQKKRRPAIAQEECMLTKSIVIKRPQGLEARPIAELVQVASKYESRVYLEQGAKKVNAKSIMGMMSLHAREGECIEVMIDGNDEERAMTEIAAFLCAGSRAAEAYAAV